MLQISSSLIIIMNNKILSERIRVRPRAIIGLILWLLVRLNYCFAGRNVAKAGGIYYLALVRLCKNLNGDSINAGTRGTFLRQSLFYLC